MRRRRLVLPPGMLPAAEHPAPEYPEYKQLLADAQDAAAADGPFIDPVKVRRCKELRRGWEWKVSVLGHDGTQSKIDMHLLLLADERDLTPPPPQWLLDARAEGERRDEANRARRKANDDADEKAWAQVREQCQVEVAVLRNGTARPRKGQLHNLGHAVPTVDAVSGRSRRHPAGRALCETEQRAKALDLSGGEGGAVTCVSCLNYAPKIRPAAPAA